jgi:hypothetical protein
MDTSNSTPLQVYASRTIFEVGSRYEDVGKSVSSSHCSATSASSSVMSTVVVCVGPQQQWVVAAASVSARKMHGGEQPVEQDVLRAVCCVLCAVCCVLCAMHLHVCVCTCTHTSSPYYCCPSPTSAAVKRACVRACVRACTSVTSQ